MLARSAAGYRQQQHHGEHARSSGIYLAGVMYQPWLYLTHNGMRAAVRVP